MPPKKVVKASAKGKKSSARLAAAAAAASSNTTFSTSTSSAIATTTAANSSSARARYREARGVPDDIGKATNNATQDRFRAKKKVKTTSAWKNANPKEKERMLIAAANAVMKEQVRTRFDWLASI